IYNVQQGDTMLGIAQQFGISLETLMAANPGIDPAAMSVGAELNIPSGPDDLSAEPTPTPVPLSLASLDCYPAIDKSLWCFALVHNDYPEYVENVSAQIALYDPAGKRLTAQVAAPLLNVIPPGGWLPLVAFFPPTLIPEAEPRLTWLTAVRLLPDETRYLPASAQDVLVVVDQSGRFAAISGEVRLAEDADPASLVWVAATAYDSHGRVVGVRRWEAESTLQPGEGLPFEMQVSSLGDLIERVEVTVEARP
ncbi:MAG: LysM peptidoglycan-binding domain-containing protein, partial [Chloroflexota bacterium]